MVGVGIERDMGTNGCAAPQGGGAEDHVGKPPGCAVEGAGGDGDATTLYVGGRRAVPRLSLGGVGTGETGTGRVTVLSANQLGFFAKVSDPAGRLSVSIGISQTRGEITGDGDTKTPVYWA